MNTIYKRATNENNEEVVTSFYVWGSLPEALEALDKVLITKEREDGSKYVCLSEEIDKQLRGAYQTLIRKLHREEQPNDWRYGIVKELCWKLAERKNYNNPETSLEDLLEVCWEVADNCCDISNSSIFQWLADNPGRCEFEEESLSLNPDGINSLWRVARSRQCEEIELMARQLLECLDDGIADGI